MRRHLAIAAAACLAVLTSCADLPTTARAPGAAGPLRADELTEEELAGLERFPLDFLTIDPSFPDGHHWFNYWRYQQMGITFEGGYLDGVYDFEATVPHGWKWRPGADIQVYPYRATYFHELRFTSELGGRIRRVELDFDNTGHVWDRVTESTYFTCHDRNGDALGAEEVNGSGDPDPVVSAAIIGRNFGRCRTESKGGYAITGMRLTLLPDQTAKPVLRCHGDLGENRVTRGQTLRCQVREDPATAPGDLTVSAWSFNGISRTDGDVASPIWEGPMAEDGTVEVRARIGSGTDSVLSARISVEPRIWPVMRYGTPRTLVHVDPLSMAAYPPAGRAWGRFEPTWPDFASVPATGISTGPNAGSWILRDPVGLPAPIVHLHPGLFPSSSGGAGGTAVLLWHLWYLDQNGRGSGTCNAPDVSTFRSNVERHEGLSMAPISHFGVANDVLRSENLHRRFEAVVSKLDLDHLRFEANDLWQNFLAAGSAYRTRQNAFDATDTPVVYAIGCTLDDNLSDP